jgi:predicted small metal-binding protein
MKTMTCRELGGPCNELLSADTWEDMVRKMTAHVMREHPSTAKEMERMHHEDPKRWAREMKPKWEAKPQA